MRALVLIVSGSYFFVQLVICLHALIGKWSVTDEQRRNALIVAVVLNCLMVAACIYGLSLKRRKKALSPHVMRLVSRRVSQEKVVPYGTHDRTRSGSPGFISIFAPPPQRTSTPQILEIRFYNK